jgi:putative transposase
MQGFVLKVSESGYYQWRKRKPCPSDLEAKQQLEKQVTQVFEQSHQTYGSPRVRAALVQKGVRCSRRKVARLMREKGLVSCWRRKKRKVCTTDSQHNQPVAPNRLNRDFTATAPNQKWMGDITGVWTEEGWLYLAALVDVYSRKVVGWATRYIRDEQLVFGENALWMALIGRQPEAGLVHHTDRGSQYTARSYLVPRGAFTLRGRAFNEQSWELLGQCVVRKLLRQFEGGMHRPLPFCKSANG